MKQSATAEDRVLRIVHYFLDSAASKLRADGSILARDYDAYALGGDHNFVIYRVTIERRFLWWKKRKYRPLIKIVVFNPDKGNPKHTAELHLSKATHCLITSPVDELQKNLDILQIYYTD